MAMHAAYNTGLEYMESIRPCTLRAEKYTVRYD